MNTELWNLRDRLRMHPNGYDVLSILNEAKVQGIETSLIDLRELILRDARGQFISCPEFVTAFILSYFKAWKPKSILDCWAGFGATLVPLVQEYEPDIAIGLNRSTNEHEIATLMWSNPSVVWQKGEPLELLDQIKPSFDAIVGCLPFGQRPTVQIFQYNDQEIEIRDDYANLLLLKSATLLNDSGSALFVVSPRFLFDRNEKKVISNLTRFDLHLDAAFHLPNGTFAPTTQISGLLVLIHRENNPNLFVGEISSEMNQRDVLLKNLRTRKAGKTPHLGFRVDRDTFYSFPTLVVQDEISRLARSLGLPPIKLMDICVSINLSSRKFDTGFEDLPNTVYLPIIGKSHAVASITELKLKTQNYVQLVIDLDKAVSSYIAHFFNTPLGQKIRESLTSGFIPKITKTLLPDAVVYLPDKATQIEIISTQSTLTNISSELEILSRELWSYPRKYKDIQRQVNSIQRSDSFEEWMETLPFPIGSILWAYYADVNIEHKVEHLFLFFEALAEFVATILLSAYASNLDFYIQEHSSWIDSDPKHKEWILNSSFGGWRNLSERLAKATRRLKEDKEKREVCTSLLGNPSSEFLDMITDKNFFGILKEVNDYRNLWKGHPGASNYQLHEERLKLLDIKLSEIRSITQDKWTSALLLSPKASEYSQGVFEYQVMALKGTRSVFKQVKVRTLVPMDKNKLYILHDQQQKPVELLPFVRLIESPKTKAVEIYFYNRVQKGDEVRWVSYYFDKDPEIFSNDGLVSSAIKLLLPQD